jgi:hypothetical protein
MKIMVLADGDTFSPLEGCTMYEVPDGLETEDIERMLEEESPELRNIVTLEADGRGQFRPPVYERTVITNGVESSEPMPERRHDLFMSDLHPDDRPESDPSAWDRDLTTDELCERITKQLQLGEIDSDSLTIKVTTREIE